MGDPPGAAPAPAEDGATTAPRRRTASVRVRVTAASVVAVAVVLVAMAVGVALLQRGALLDALDETLAADAEAIARAVEVDGTGADLEVRGDDDEVAQVVVDGEVVAGSPDEALLPTAPPDDDPPEPGEDPDATVTSADPVGDLDGRQRVASVAITLPDGRDATVHVAAPLDDVDESTGALVTAMAIAVPVALVVLGALVWWLIGRALRPVEAMRRQVASIGGGGLDRRVPVPPTDDEVGRLARTMNDMLDRIEQASLRERAFVADASHELRTPLTRMRTELEVDLAHPGTADLAATHRSVLEELDGLQALVTDLLALARLDASPAEGQGTELVDLADVAEDVVARTRSAVPITVRASDGEALVRGDPGQLRRAVANVVENGARHARSRVEVDVSGGQDGTGAVRVAVDDDGPGIREAERARAFERFTQLDAARSDGHAGLGLAITREIVDRHGGTASIGDSPLGGARVLVELPAAPAR
jgi:signal transduction histidine kinase